MNKYEIMLLVHSTASQEEVEKFVNEIFKSKKELTKLERTQLAYPIKKVNTAQYFVLNVEASAEEIKEFNRREVLNKSILRTLVINLDTEKPLQRKPKTSKARRPKFVPRSNDKKPFVRKFDQTNSNDDKAQKPVRKFERSTKKDFAKSPKTEE
ncbi:30S ribosomal protein S6 [Mycoplasma zalophi]|uniref:Small ribosomal subunit protein bS6 n=1 Tax=Mycoplasma zalophi TaxID=191287 RepID=A0ABS6DNY8_9MOLU|nr:30S ribosomal protein S6 [Mycoplasma zalophi]MBU4691195.1 30S ribosomal protein S6 [Mycoplasma zalophi]MBU4692030.1 30S ribosomal protein S6 [Mycoplasma zalophi]